MNDDESYDLIVVGAGVAGALTAKYLTRAGFRVLMLEAGPDSAKGLDGGGSVAADTSGNVQVFWHAPEPGKRGEDNRRVWSAVSSDDGKTFAAERAVGAAIQHAARLDRLEGLGRGRRGGQGNRRREG